MFASHTTIPISFRHCNSMWLKIYLSFPSPSPTCSGGQVVYDAQNERVFTQENYRASGGSAHHGHAGFQILTLFQERMSYVTCVASLAVTLAPHVGALHAGRGVRGSF